MKEIGRMKYAALHFRWRVGLAAGKLLKRIGSALLDQGWAICDHSARHWYREEFTPGRTSHDH